MNKQLQEFARSEIKKGLAQCTEGQQMVFKRMYAHKNLDMPIDQVVNGIPIEKLDWAMQQVERTVTVVNKK